MLAQKNMYIAAALGVVVVGLFVYLGYFSMGTQQPVAEVAQGATAAQELLNDISASGGVTSLQIVDTVVGTGAEARTGDIVTVNYIGVLPNGTVFDASQAHGKPFTFTLGAGQVIRGWEQGIPGMKVGGTRIVAIPPELGYGAQSIGQIPANASLIFQVELVSVGSGATQ